MSGDTERFEDPPEGPAGPTEWERARPRYFGAPPQALAAGLAAVALGAAVVLLVTGQALLGVALLLAAILLAALYVQQARSRRDSSLDRVAAAAIDHSRALAGLAGTTVSAWTSAGRRVTALRLEANRLARRRSQLQYALGGAAYAEDEAQAAELRAQMREVEEQIAERVREAQRVIAEARTRTAQERFAAAPTEVHPPRETGG